MRATPTGLEGLLEGITAQLLPLITEMVRKAVEAALAPGVAADSHRAVRGAPEAAAEEPKPKRRQGEGKSNKRKTPDAAGGQSGEPRPQPNRRGKGAENKPQPDAVRPQTSSEDDGTWQTVHRRDSELFELRSQDWDAPVTSHANIGKQLDELKDGSTLEAVVLASRADLQKVEAILRGTQSHVAGAHQRRQDGDTRIPGRVGNMLRFRQANVVTITSAGKAEPRCAGHRAKAVKVAPLDTAVISIRIPEAYLTAEKWKGFRSNPTHAVATWAAEQKVILADSWGWLEECLGKLGRQSALWQGENCEEGAHELSGRDGAHLGTWCLPRFALTTNEVFGCLPRPHWCPVFQGPQQGYCTYLEFSSCPKHLGAH